MANGKSPDTRGIVAELLKHCGKVMLQAVADLFNDILMPSAPVPEEWKMTRLRVLFKKGSAQDTENYRPIAVLPILYKLFSKVLCGRVQNILTKAQSVDQAGFRPGFSCEDHLFVMALLTEMFSEFRQPLWAVAVDFRKAFDTVCHNSLWNAMLEQGVPSMYVCWLQKLYEDQRGQVHTDCASKEFRIKRGVRQGDPISPILFNFALEDLMRKLTGKWSQRRRNGIDVNCKRLTNLRFADDLLLLAPSLAIARTMLKELMQEARAYGLQVHEEKTKILWNGEGRGTKQKSVEVENRRFDVLPKDGSTMYLGRLLSFTTTHEVEIEHRIKKAWAKFAIF